MKHLKYLILGVLFGIIMVKSEAISWYRIQEMFRFQSFHMYGIIGVAVATGAIGLWIIKSIKLRDMKGNLIQLPDKKFEIQRYLLGGTIFGLGWALAGSCPGPLFVSLGYGYSPMILLIVSAIAGTWAYGFVRK
jgi:uncharacterized membrane protein YedE/YeeE